VADAAPAPPVAPLVALQPDPSQAPPALLPQLLHGLDFLARFGTLLGAPRAARLGWRRFARAALREDGALLHGAFVPLVGALYRDLPAAGHAFLGRPLNSLTWPELLRQYLRMVALEYQVLRPKNPPSLIPPFPPPPPLCFLTPAQSSAVKSRVPSYPWSHFLQAEGAHGLVQELRLEALSRTLEAEDMDAVHPPSPPI
jgi:hypothetical protein